MPSIYYKTGLFFGSFNPVHNGHLEIARYMLLHEDLGEIWFVVSPQNPLKESEDLAGEKHRLEMIKIAVSSEPKFQASDVELSMPKPSYTIHTLEFLSHTHRERNFSLIIGSDNLEDFHLWKDFQKILNNYHILVYPRKKEFNNPYSSEPNVMITQAPLIEISSTQIRSLIRAGGNVSHFIPNKVRNYIDSEGLYRI